MAKQQRQRQQYVVNGEAQNPNAPIKYVWQPGKVFDYMFVNYLDHKDDVDTKSIEQYGLDYDTLMRGEAKKYVTIAGQLVDDGVWNLDDFKKRPLFINLGGSRSGKSYDAFDFIVKWCDDNRLKDLSIDVYRETLVKARGTTLEDCLKCFDFIGLRRNIDYTLTGEINAIPTIKLWGNTIQFKGLPAKGSEAGMCDVAFVNEIFEVADKSVIMGIRQRCKKCMILDANPSLTQHWAMEMKDEFNVFYTWTSYLDNIHLPVGFKMEAESWCGWDFDDSVIEVDSLGFKRRRWLKPACKDGEIYDEAIHRRPNKINFERGTVDEWRWLTYGEGIPSPQTGAVFKDVTWISEFPANGLEQCHLGLDYGYNSDPSVLTRVGVSGFDMYAEALTYQSTPTVEILFDLITPQIEKEIERRKAEAQGGDIADIIIVCDSQDRYKDSQFTTDLQNLAFVRGKDWQFVKCKKPQIVTRVGLVKRFRLHLVENNNVRLEQQNYTYLKHPDGTPMNIPDPSSKWCHFWDSMGYVSWYFFRYYLNV